MLKVFDADELRYLRQSYASFVPGIDISEVPQAYRKYKAGKWWLQHLETDKHGKPTCIKAYWIGENGNIAIDPVLVKLFSFSVKIS